METTARIDVSRVQREAIDQIELLKYDETLTDTQITITVQISPFGQVKTVKSIGQYLLVSEYGDANGSPHSKCWHVIYTHSPAFDLADCEGWSFDGEMYHYRDDASLSFHSSDRAKYRSMWLVESGADEGPLFADEERSAIVYDIKELADSNHFIE